MKSIKCKPYYKKVDWAMMNWGLVLPQSHVGDFLGRNRLGPGTSREIDILWDKKIYKAQLRHDKAHGITSVYQIRWDGNRELLKKVRKTFIQTYVILKSQKELFDIGKSQKKHFRTSLSGGQQEVLILQPIGKRKISCKVFIKIDNGWNTLFSRLADENVFGWLFDKEKKYLVTRSTGWIKVRDFNKHAGAVNVIYYLAHTKKRLLYIGKAEILGKRVKPRQSHQNMPGGWNLFKYDIIKPEYANLLRRIEDHTIRSFAAVLRNKKGYLSLEVGDYTLVNANWHRL